MQNDRGAAPIQDCSCAKAKIEGGWCDKCKAGYLAGVRIESSDLFEALDAHGHDVDPASIRCPSCRAALDSDGYCEKCHFGFVQKKAYLSRLTYLIAKGEAKKPNQIVCDVCRKNAEHHGWCERCGVGMVSNVSHRDRRLYDQLIKEYERLLAAVEMQKKCVWCSIAMMTDGRCPDCKITYKDGRRAEMKKP
jgi:hypothetical protein